MRIRLFWHILATFALLIILGVGGTTVVLAATIGKIFTGSMPATLELRRNTWSELLSDYYVAHDESWTGVEQRLDALQSVDSWGFPSPLAYNLFDQRGAIVAAGGPEPAPNERRAGDATPVYADGVQVGTLVMGSRSDWYSRSPQNWQGMGRGYESSGRFGPSVGQQIGRGFRLAALTMGGVALALAVLMSRRVSAPLSALTRATQQVAAGQPPVQLRRSSIREVQTLSQAFSKMAADLVRADRLRRNMTADIAHELRTPLTIIKGKLEGILDGVYPGTEAHLLPILEEANLLERVIEDLRLLSLAEAGQLPLHSEPLEVADLLHDVERQFAAAAKTQRVALEVSVPSELPPLVADGQRMQQVLGNLVSNSLRHTPPGGRVDLRAQSRPGLVQIEVADNGSGIGPEELEHIFDRFWRGDKARSRHGSGAGLGLAIARQFVEAQGGRIDATSQLGAGTTVTLTFPAGAEGELTDTAG